MPKDSSRPSLPTSSSDFALPSSSLASTSSVTLEDASFMLHRFRRPSVHAPKATYISETRLQSPLVSSFTLQASPIKRKAYSDDECSEDSSVYRERKGRENSPSSSSENPTPPLAVHETSEESEDGGRVSKSKMRTPPRKASVIDNHLIPRRRLSFPVRSVLIVNVYISERLPSFKSNNPAYSIFWQSPGQSKTKFSRRLHFNVWWLQGPSFQYNLVHRTPDPIEVVSQKKRVTMTFSGKIRPVTMNPTMNLSSLMLQAWANLSIFSEIALLLAVSMVMILTRWVYQKAFLASLAWLWTLTLWVSYSLCRSKFNPASALYFTIYLLTFLDANKSLAIYPSPHHQCRAVKQT